MTNEEIAALRAQVDRHLKVYHETSLKALDDLCKAARQSNSLVGRRVLVKANKDAQGYRITGERTMYCIGRFDGDEFLYAHTALAERGDFELLEDTNAR